MPDRPLLLFPLPELAERTKRPQRIPPPVFPNIARQYDRLSPYFSILRTAFLRKTIAVQNSPIGINPEFALVFEVVGSVESFFSAVKHVNGFEWMFESSSDDIEPDDDFYNVDKAGSRKETKLSGRVYCVMSNQEAMSQLLSLWRRYKSGDTNVFERGFAGLRDVFTHIKVIRLWGAEDRIYETQVMNYWRETLEVDGDQMVPFEIELFYRNSLQKRQIAYETIRYAISDLGGAVQSQCIIDEINFHSLLVVLPRQQIQRLVEEYEQISIVSIDDIMFFRPVSQAVAGCYDDTSTLEMDLDLIENPIEDEPIIGIFDGMPIQNHRLLSGKLIIDDPDNYESNYLEKFRCHGTAMASLIIYGDLSNFDKTHKRKIYLRPIMKPYSTFSDTAVERIPADVIFVDLIHRAVKRMYEGEGTEPATAPTVKVINLSVGDPVRQFGGIMSPLARLLDWLSYKYKVLFVVSAGNQNNSGLNLGKTFDEFKALSLEQRDECVFSHLMEEIRNLRVLSPAENMNGLSIGALYADGCVVTENERQLSAVSYGLPSPISSFGLGYNRTITPDLYYYGGRKFLVRSRNSGLRWGNGSGEPGCKVAAPYGDGTESGQAYTFGTSDAAAQITHEVGKCYNVLTDIFTNETSQSIPVNYEAVLIKGILTHGASWFKYANDISHLTQQSENRLFRWLGNGIPDISRIVECTNRRITLIGLGSLTPEHAHVFKLPLPFDFSRQLVKRRLTVTLSYFSPITPTKLKYRSTQLFFELEQPQILFSTRENTDTYIVRRGTLQHEIFGGNNAVVWDSEDNIKIKVNCKNDAENSNEPIQYSLFVTFEVINGLDVDIYTAIENKLQQVIPITTLA